MVAATTTATGTAPVAVDRIARPYLDDGKANVLSLDAITDLESALSDAEDPFAATEELLRAILAGEISVNSITVR